MHITIHSLIKQRGAATLVVALILLLAITLMTFSGVRVGVSEQRIATNDLRAKRAMTVAEGLIENGIAFLEANKTYINDTTLAAGWLFAGVGAARWQPCTASTITVPCGTGTANVYNNTWLYYTPPAAQITSVSSGIYPTAYTEGVSFITPNLGTVAAPVVADFPRVDVIANVSPNADTLAGSAQAKQTVQGVKLSSSIPRNTLVAAGQVPIGGNLQVWGNPTGLASSVISTSVATNPAAANSIIAYNNRPTAVSGITLWTTNAGAAIVAPALATAGQQSDESNATYIKTNAHLAPINLTISNNANYVDPVGTVTIGVRALTVGNEALDWGLVLGGTAYFDTVTGTPSVPVTLTTAWNNYFKTWTTNPATNLAWTRADIAGLSMQIRATQNGAASDVQVAEVWVDGYRVRYTVSALGSLQTVVEKGFPLSVTSRDSTVTLGGSMTTCRNWAATTPPDVSVTPYTDWFPGGATARCNTTAETLSSSGYTNLDIQFPDPSIPADIFQYIFGVPRTQYLEIKYGADAVVLADCSSLTAASTGFFWITGGCNPGNDNLGTTSKPIILVVEGDITLNGGPEIHGMVYSFTPPGGVARNVQINGNVVLVGALVSDQNIDTANGSFILVYSRSVLQNAGKSFGSFAKVPGSWTDQL